MFTSSTPDAQIPVKRLQLNRTSGKFVAAPKKDLFLRGPIPLNWLSKAARLPGKTLNVGLALWWLNGMTTTPSVKLTRRALELFEVGRDAASAALSRLEHAELVQVDRRIGRRPLVVILQQESG